MPHKSRRRRRNERKYAPPSELLDSFSQSMLLVAPGSDFSISEFEKVTMQLEYLPLNYMSVASVDEAGEP